MEQTELVRNLREVVVKLEGGINMLFDGKQVQSYQRLIGIRDKLMYLLGLLDTPQEKEK